MRPLDEALDQIEKLLDDWRPGGPTAGLPRQLFSGKVVTCAVGGADKASLQGVDDSLLVIRCGVSEYSPKGGN